MVPGAPPRGGNFDIEVDLGEPGTAPATAGQFAKPQPISKPAQMRGWSLPFNAPRPQPNENPRPQAPAPIQVRFNTDISITSSEVLQL